MQNLAKKLLVISLTALLITACFSIIAKIGNSPSKPSIPTTSISVPDSSSTSDKTSFVIKDTHDMLTEEPDEIL